MTFEYIAAMVRRSLPIVIIGMLGLGAVALVYSLFAPHVYQATARVIVEPRTQTFTANQDVLSGLPARDETVVDTEVEFLESRSVAIRVVSAQKLTRDPEFGAATFGASVDKFSRALAIRRVGLTYLIEIAVDSRSPDRAAALANATASTYIQMQKERKRAATQSANDLLRSRVASMEGEVREADSQVQRFRIANDLMSINGTTLAEQSAATINDQLSTARAAEAAAQGELAAAQRAGGSLDQANAQQSLGTLRAQQATAMQEMSAAQAKYGAQHPNYVAAQQRLTQINQAIAGETSRARAAVSANAQTSIAALRAKAAAASNLRQSLEGSSGANAAGLNRNSRAATQLAELERRATALRTTYETYLNRYQQTLTQLGTEQSDSSLISPASVPSAPYKPNLGLNVALGLLAGLLAGIAISTLTMLLSPYLSTADQIEQGFDLEALPSLPTAQSGELGLGGGRAAPGDIARAMLAHPTNVFSEMHKNLLAAVSRPVDGRRNQVIALTSSLPKEGKTTAAICLAAMAAHTGKRTILIDCDQRRRTATRQLVGETTAGGLREVLVSGAAWRTVIAAASIPGLDVLPASPTSDADIDIFGGEAFAALIAQLRKEYDLVLLDTAPVLPIADTRILVSQVDSVLVFCRWRSTSRRALESALAILGRAGAPIAGISLTLVDLAKQSRYGYGDPVFYYRKYKDYYATAG